MPHQPATGIMTRRAVTRRLFKPKQLAAFPRAFKHNYTEAIKKQNHDVVQAGRKTLKIMVFT